VPTPSTRAAGSLRHWPLLIVVAGVLCGLAVTMLGRDTWRLGCVIIGSSLGIGAVERTALSRRDAGLLEVRGRLFDILVMALTGAAIIALAIAVPERR
jgi:hypothetical protein